MIKLRWFHIPSLALMISMAWLPQPQLVAAQSSNTVARVVAAVNADRVANGLPPYKLNSLLTLSAQRHSEYQASIGQWTHSSPDGGRALQRAQAVGYPATRANENVYAGNVSPEEAVNWWYTADADHRNNVLHTAMREIGVGAAADANGTIYYTMDISAQPNVLPVFINSDAYSTSSASVTLTLTNEFIFGGGPGQIGQVSQVLISNSPDFAGASPQGWAQSLPWTLDTSAGAGQKTVYVRYIDGAGRTADAQASISWDGSGGAAPPPAVQPTAAPTDVPVIQAPTSAPVRPQPTAVPLQPTHRPTDTPPPPTATAVQVAVQPIQPTLDFADSLYMRAKRGELVDTSASADAQTGTSPLADVRRILWVALMAGIAAIALGILRLRAFQRAHSTIKETPSDGDD